MPWSVIDYPAMNNLERDVRNTAIEIANAMLRNGCDDGMAIRVGISRAQQWEHSDTRYVLRRERNAVLSSTRRYIDISAGCVGWFFWGGSAAMQSVVRINPATEAAFCSAWRVTFVGSMTPVSTRSPYCPVAAL